MEKAIRPIFILLVVFSLLDFWATNSLIATHGFVAEANPFLVHWMNHFQTSYTILGIKLVSLMMYLVMLNYVFTVPKYAYVRPRVAKATVALAVIQFLVAALGTYMVLSS